MSQPQVPEPVGPEATVEARRYRLRVLNATQARFLNLQLYVDDGSADGITLNAATLAPTNAKGPDFMVIGTEPNGTQLLRGLPPVEYAVLVEHPKYMSHNVEFTLAPGQTVD